jgi:predicted enzyme related to lactoylglutathione lyase
MSEPAHVIAWCEIPVLDFARAKAFYEALLGHPIETITMGPSTMGFLSSEPGQVSGAIVYGDGTAPSQSGTLVYLNGGDDLAVMLARVEPAGGKVAVPKTDIGNGFGHFAHFVDTEGNRVGLHSMG